jgi:hypothetical protein
MAATSEGDKTSTALLKTLERTVAEKEKDWQLQNSMSYPDLLFLRWIPKEGVEILSESDRKTRHPSPILKLYLEFYKSDDRASKELNRRVQRTSTGPHDIIRDLGDEGFFGRGNSPHGDSWFGVRTGTILITVDGPSLDITRRFAERIVFAVESEPPGNGGPRSP